MLMQALLSWDTIDGPFSVNPISANKFLSHNTSLIQADRAIYSASVDDWATVAWSFDDHITRLLNRNIVNPVRDFLSSVLLAQSASALAFVFEHGCNERFPCANKSLDFPPRVNTLLLVPCRYCSICSTASQCCFPGLCPKRATELTAGDMSGLN